MLPHWDRPAPYHPAGKAGQGRARTRPNSCSTLEDSPQLSSDLLKPSPVGFSFFQQNLGHLRGGPHLRFGVLLDFQIHHLLDQSVQRLRIHEFLSPDCIKISLNLGISVLTLDTVVRSSAQIRGTADVAPRRRLKNPDFSRSSSRQSPEKGNGQAGKVGVWSLAYFFFLTPFLGLDLDRGVLVGCRFGDFLFRVMRTAFFRTARRAGLAGLPASTSSGGGAAGPAGTCSSRQPCASRTAIIAPRMPFHVSGFIITSFGNMRPSQQMCRKALVSSPSSPWSQ